MKCLIMAGGEYGPLDRYKQVVDVCDCVLCADRGADYAFQMGIIPDCIIGDMDSISPQVWNHYNSCDVHIKKYPQRKDFTDTQLALQTAVDMGADSVIFIGSTGGRLDHTLSNLYCGVELVRMGKEVLHFSPECVIYLVSDKLELQGTKGDLVSVLPLGDQAAGVYEKGVEYPLSNALLENHNPFAISNVMKNASAEISLKDGVIAVFHYPVKSE